MKQAIHKTTITFDFPYSPSSPNSLMEAMTKTADIVDHVKKTGARDVVSKLGLSNVLVEDKK